MYILVFVVLLFVPYTAFAESLEKEATRVCSEYIKIKKDCYFKASKGVLPVNGMKGIKTKLPKELAEKFCSEGFDAFGRAGKLKLDVINQAMQQDYKQCFDGYVKRGNCAELESAIKQASYSMENYFADFSKYPDEIPYKSPSPQISISLIDSNEQEYTILVTSDGCNKTYKRKSGNSQNTVGNK